MTKHGNSGVKPTWTVCAQTHTNMSLPPSPECLPNHSALDSTAPNRNPPLAGRPFWITALSSSSFLDHSTQRLFVPAPNQPGKHCQLSTPMHLDFSVANYDLNGTQPCIPNLVIPANAVPFQPMPNGTSLRVNRTHTPPILNPPPSVPLSSFLDYLDTLPV
jgi:hypothetical protein